MSARRSNLWKTLASMSELDTEDLVEDRWRTLLSGTIKKHPANIRLDEDVLKTSWRRLSSSPSEDILIKTNMFTLALCLQRTSSRRLQDQNICLGYTSSRCIRDVFKTSSRRLQDIFKKSSRHLQDVFKTSSRRTIKINCST